jgi:hypothetical protein
MSTHSIAGNENFTLVENAAGVFQNLNVAYEQATELTVENITVLFTQSLVMLPLVSPLPQLLPVFTLIPDRTTYLPLQLQRLNFSTFPLVLKLSVCVSLTMAPLSLPVEQRISLSPTKLGLLPHPPVTV